ncbi:MAG TPA: ATPase [Methanoregulaceae archaeon]|jgi:V/A-type H+-transporting ATPase subunit K|nr:ATPase [Methanoregulaceae archaeon]
MVENWAVPIGAGIAFFGGAIACGWAQSRIGAAGAGTVAEKPETAGVIIILEALPETLVILGFVVATLIILMS